MSCSSPVRHAAALLLGSGLALTSALGTAADSAASYCPGTASGGFLLGRFSSDTQRGTQVCRSPAYRCQSCDYSRTTSTCNNADCTTVDCYCASVPVNSEIIFVYRFDPP